MGACQGAGGECRTVLLSVVRHTQSEDLPKYAELPLDTTATAKEVVVHQGVEERDAVVGFVREGHAANLASTGRHLTARERATLTYRHAYRVTLN